MRKHYLLTGVLLLAVLLGSIGGASAPVAATNGVEVQLAMILDGSGSISDTNWSIMINGLADAVENADCVPQDGSLELTVIQFGDYGAMLEVGPVVITLANAAPAGNSTVGNQIRAISQMKGFTPIACAIRLAADVLAGDPGGNLTGTPWEGQASVNFDPDMKQALNLVTDGAPNVCCPGPGYIGEYCGYDDGEDSAEAARGYALTTLQMTDPSDEFDAEFIGAKDGESEWLRTEIVWPEQADGNGYYAPPFDKGPGWVRVVPDAATFAATICEKFEVIIEPASKTFNLTITGCEPEDVVYTVSLNGGSYQTMTGTPPSYTFTDLIVGQAYDYSIKADGEEILSGTTGELGEGENVNNLSYEWPCASKTFSLTITGCEPEDVVYTVSLNGGSYQTMTGTPPSYTFTGLIVGQAYSYCIEADGEEILSGTTGELEEDENVNNLSYEWPCASKTFNLTITGCEPEDVVYEVSLDGDTQTMAGTPPSYTFTGLVVGQAYSYSIEADGEEILSGATGELEEGENVNNLSYEWPCASITIIKDADPSDGTDFDFTGDLGAFTLDDAVPDDGDLVSSSKSFTDLVPGSHVITESDVAGWDLRDISCTGDATVEFGDGTTFHGSFTEGDDSVKITLGAGQSATCTFTNEERVIPQAPEIDLTKTPTDGAGHEITLAYVDDTIVYVFEVKNPGVVDLVSVTLTDDTGVCDAMPVRGTDNPGNNDDTLEPGEVWVYTCSHLVTAGDPDPLENTATAQGWDAEGVPTEDEDTATVAIVKAPPPVGGMVASVNKVEVVAPWLGLIALSACGLGWVVLRRREI